MDRYSNLSEANKTNQNKRNIGIQSVQQTDKYILHFMFQDGLNGSIDFLPILTRRSVFAAYKDPELFRQWYVNQNGTTIEWPGNKLDFYFIQLRNYLQHGHLSTH